MRCLSCDQGCKIARELEEIGRAARSPREVNEAIADLVRQTFSAMSELIKKKKITNETQLGNALGTVFDVCMSVLYAQGAANADWLYCPAKEDQQAMLFYPYIRSCPRCGKIAGEVPKHKPSSDTIGRYASLVIAAILEEICIRTQNGWEVRVLMGSRSDIDLLLLSNSLLVLCEVKASPLIAFPLCKPLDAPLTKDVEGELITITTHRSTDNPDWQVQEHNLYLPVHGVPVKLGKGDLVRCFVEQSSDEELLRRFVDVWTRLFDGYRQRWRENRDSNLRWLTFGCGGDVDDSKNAPGLDRTDDIKKGIYQLLKLGEKFRNCCKAGAIRIGLVSNLPPVRHYTEYLQGFEDAVWTQERKLHRTRQPAWMRVQTRDLTPFYDVLLTLTHSWFRDGVVEQAFQLRNLFIALGGAHD